MLTRSEILTALEGMAVGDSRTFPVNEVKLIRAYASEYGFMTGRRYETRTNREPLQLIVTRRS